VPSMPADNDSPYSPQYHFTPAPRGDGLACMHASGDPWIAIINISNYYIVHPDVRQYMIMNKIKRHRRGVIYWARFGLGKARSGP